MSSRRGPSHHHSVKQDLPASTACKSPRVATKKRKLQARKELPPT